MNFFPSHTYWYASERGLVDGKIKRTWQEYLGTTAALLSISDELNYIDLVACYWFLVDL